MEVPMPSAESPRVLTAEQVAAIVNIAKLDCGKSRGYATLGELAAMQDRLDSVYLSHERLRSAIEALRVERAADSARWQWIKQFLHVEPQPGGGEFLFFSDDRISLWSLDPDGCGHTVDSLADFLIADAARAVRPAVEDATTQETT